MERWADASWVFLPLCEQFKTHLLSQALAHDGMQTFMAWVLMGGDYLSQEIVGWRYAPDVFFLAKRAFQGLATQISNARRL